MTLVRIPRLLRWRYLRWALVLPLLPLALWACNAHPLEEPMPLPEQQTDQYYEVNPNRNIDILFMIDNSPSMQEEQENLQRNFRFFMEELRKIPNKDGVPTLPSVQLGVVSSDLGAGGQMIGQCAGAGDSGVLQDRGWVGGLPTDPGRCAKKASCGLKPGPTGMPQRFLIAGEGVANNFVGNLEDVFSCVAQLGTCGCGLEHQLQATRVALYGSLDTAKLPFPVENLGFLRSDAYLAIVLLTDEDDCSAVPNTTLFSDSGFPGTVTSFRCAQTGHLCDGKETPKGAVFKRGLDKCTANDGGRLIPIKEIVESIRALKPRPEQQIIVSGIFGWPTTQDPNREYEYAKVRVLPDGSSVRDPAGDSLDYMEICSAPRLGKATAALRVKQFVTAFNGTFESICQDDFRPVMEKIGKRIAAVLSRTCVEAPVIFNANVPDCQVAYRYDDATQRSGFREEALPWCDAPGSGTAPVCWRLEGDAQCTSSQYKIRVDRTDMPPKGTRLAVKCASCVNPTDERCKR